MKPQHINRLKVFHSINTNTLQGMGHELHGDNHSANTLFEDLFIRKFVNGVYWRQIIPEKGIGVIRRLNEIEIIVTITLVSTVVKNRMQKNAILVFESYIRQQMKKILFFKIAF